MARGWPTGVSALRRLARGSGRRGVIDVAGLRTRRELSFDRVFTINKRIAQSRGS